LSTYADTSVVVCLYVPDVHSPQAHQHMARHPKVWLTPLHQAEFAHVVAQQIFQRRISAVEAMRAYDSFEDDRRIGLWLASAMPEAVFELVVDLARRHVARLGCRTLDTLHVACALELGAQQFLTFDQRQEKLAKAVGLSVA